jgi:hypothetical protein
VLKSNQRQTGKQTEMSPERITRRRNVEKIASDSVASGEIDAQREELTAIEDRLQVMERDLIRLRERVARLRQQLSAARSRHRERNNARTLQALDRASEKLAHARQQRDTMLSGYRELKLVVRDQRALLRSLERKEAAKQEAVARFLKEWERDYDQKMGINRKRIRKRKQMLDR